MVKSVKGKEVNMTELAQRNADSIALGNSKMNARGDILGKGGKVVKTREDLAREYHTKGTNAVKNVPLSGEINKMLETPTPVAQVVEDVDTKPKKKKQAEAKVEVASEEPVIETPAAE